MSAFHSYDIRGIWGVDFDASVVYKVGFFIPELLGTKEVLVGRDIRLSSDEVHDALLKGLTDAGADVYDIGLSSTPLVYFGTAYKGFKASVQITASHNSGEYNGLKVSRENALPVGFDTGLGTIKKWIDEGKETNPVEVKGSVHQMDIKKDYMDFLSKYKGDFSDVKLVLDLSNGMANLFAKDLFGPACDYINDTLDGHFPGHDPNPLVAENRELLKAQVIEKGADAGVIFDGDADRVMFIDNEGEFISPDLVIALMGHYFVEERGEKGIVLQDIRSSKSVGEYLEPMGCKMETWKVGRANAALKLRELDGVWGGELAGHYYFRDFFYSDSGLLASMLVLRVVAAAKAKGETIKDLNAKISNYQSSGEVNFRIEDKEGAIKAVCDYFTAQATPTKIMDFDGYRIEFPDWWFNVRPSNTEPYLRFICEATSQELLQEKLAEAKKILAQF